VKTEIVKLCADLFDLPSTDLLGRKRNKQAVEARFALYAALRQRGWSYPRIGRFLGRDHASIMYGVRRAEYIMERHRPYEEKVERVAMWQPEHTKVSKPNA
jgi:chromosomal replication initiation ATPase DnaA